MAGERSKTIGEIGEKIAEKFFSKIGWGLPQKGMYYKCYKPKDHALSTSVNGEKRQHGIDFQYSYKSSLEANTLNNLVISVKHIKDSTYPQSATEKFKEHIRDLIHTTECFKVSAERREINSRFTGCTQTNEIPVLFYISSKNNDDDDFIIKIQNSRFLSDYDIKELYIIDNKRITFILDAIEFIESKYKDWDWFFYHPLTGLNLSDKSISYHSKRMQVEYLTSPIIPFLLKKKVGDDEVCKFAVATIHGFSEDSFSRLITYCRDNTLEHITQYEILMPDYFADDHDQIRRKITNALENPLNINIKNYHPNFRTLADE